MVCSVLVINIKIYALYNSKRHNVSLIICLNGAHWPFPQPLDEFSLGPLLAKPKTHSSILYLFARQFGLKWCLRESQMLYKLYLSEVRRISPFSFYLLSHASLMCVLLRLFVHLIFKLKPTSDESIITYFFLFYGVALSSNLALSSTTHISLTIAWPSWNEIEKNMTVHHFNNKCGKKNFCAFVWKARSPQGIMWDMHQEKRKRKKKGGKKASG